MLPLKACCVLLDAHSLRRDDATHRNIVAALLELNACTEPGAVLEALDAMATWLPDMVPEGQLSGLADEIADWLTVCMARVMPPETTALARRILTQEEDDNMMALARTAREWQKTWKAEGQVELLREQARRKFGHPAAAALARVEPGHHAEALPHVAAWIVDCDTASDFLAKLDELPSRR